MQSRFLHRLYGLLGAAALAVLPLSAAAAAAGASRPAVTASGYHSCALSSAGTVQCWGSNLSGELGVNLTASSLNFSPTPLPVVGTDGTGTLTGITNVAAGEMHTCALTAAGTVLCWGAGGNGELGNGGTASSLHPVPVVGPNGTGVLQGVTAISSGRVYTCALVTGGQVYCWGYFWPAVPTLVKDTLSTGAPPLSGVVALAAGWFHVCALTSRGGVLCWGENTYGALGSTGLVPLGGSTLTPFGVAGLSSGVRAITSGNQFSCALLTIGTVQCWGRNLEGELGNNTLVSSYLPSTVLDATGTVPLLNVAAVATGADAYSVCALKGTGTVSCWGLNNAGQLGNGTQTSSALPVAVLGPNGSGVLNNVATLSLGQFFSCGIVMPAGTVWCWGDNSEDELGVGPGLPNYFSAVPVQVVAGAGNSSPLTLVTPQRTTPTVVVGRAHACALSTGGAVSCWGDNSLGQLGNGSSVASTVPVPVTGLASGIVGLAAGNFGDHTCALAANGGMTCWGDNTHGQLGNATTVASPLPLAVSGLSSGVSAISAGTASTCAVLVTGDVDCWGRNTYGELAVGTSGGDLTAPGRVFGLPDAATTVSVGEVSTCIKLQSGALECSGFNLNGGLGNGTLTSSVLAVPATGVAAPQAAVAVGSALACANNSTGAVSCWGFGGAGTLGNGTQTDASSAVAVTGLQGGVRALSVSGLTACAIDSAGVASCWGRGAFAPTVNGAPATTPFTVQGLTPGPGMLAIAAGDNLSCAVSTRAQVYCWGYKGEAQPVPAADGTGVLTLGGPASSDFNGDGFSDLLWKNTDGSAAVWLMNGTTALSTATFGPYAGWSLFSGDSDFNGDGKSDLVWTHTNGAVAQWLMNGLTATSQTVFGPYPGWTLVSGNADFNGDGNSDLLWWNSSTGQAAIWLMNGATVLSQATYGPYPGWTVVSGNNDFNGDGKNDLLWTNASGAAAVWLMNGTTPASQTTFGPYPGWTVTSGDADYNGDGSTDLLWTNASGAVAVWLMNGATPLATASFGPYAGWSVVPGRRDVNGDGKSDLLWCNASGAVAFWLMTGLVPAVQPALGPFAGWSVLPGAGDYNGDGSTDLLWANADGTAALWLLTGLAPPTMASFGPFPGWSVVPGVTGP